jgi:hypothetical protein
MEGTIIKGFWKAFNIWMQLRVAEKTGKKRRNLPKHYGNICAD